MTNHSSPFDGTEGECMVVSVDDISGNEVKVEIRYDSGQETVYHTLYWTRKQINETEILILNKWHPPVGRGISPKETLIPEYVSRYWESKGHRAVVTTPLGDIEFNSDVDPSDKNSFAMKFYASPVEWGLEGISPLHLLVQQTGEVRGAIRCASCASPLVDLLQAKMYSIDKFCLTYDNCGRTNREHSLVVTTEIFSDDRTTEEMIAGIKNSIISYWNKAVTKADGHRSIDDIEAEADRLGWEWTRRDAIPSVPHKEGTWAEVCREVVCKLFDGCFVPATDETYWWVRFGANGDGLQTVELYRPHIESVVAETNLSDEVIKSAMEMGRVTALPSNIPDS